MMPTLTIAQAKEFFFDRQAVVLAIDAGRRKALSLAGAIVMRRARSSIREGRRFRKRPRGSDPRAEREVVGVRHSLPGEPPRSITGLLRRNIVFGHDQTTDSVVVGPARINRSSGAQATLEFGGTAVVGRRGRRRRVRVEARPYMAPALEKSLPRIPEQFRGAVGGPVR